MIIPYNYDIQKITDKTKYEWPRRDTFVYTIIIMEFCTTIFNVLMTICLNLVANLNSCSQNLYNLLDERCVGIIEVV